MLAYLFAHVRFAQVPQTFIEVEEDAVVKDSQSMLHMKSIPEDLTQREPAPASPVQRKVETNPLAHYHVQLAERPQMPGYVDGVGEGKAEKCGADGGGLSNGTGRWADAQSNTTYELVSRYPAVVRCLQGLRIYKAGVRQRHIFFVLDVLARCALQTSNK